MSQSLVARIERDPKTARVEDVAHLLAATKLSLIVIDDDDGEVPPEPTRIADLRNAGGRRFPPHLDVRPGIEGWWGDNYWARCERPPPAYTFDRARWRRELYRMWLANRYGADPG